MYVCGKFRVLSCGTEKSRPSVPRIKRTIATCSTEYKSMNKIEVFHEMEVSGKAACSNQRAGRKISRFSKFGLKLSKIYKNLIKFACYF